jgi:hypothetical protein
MFGEAVGVGGVFGDRQIGVVVENAAKDIAGLTRRAGDGLSAIDGVLIGSVRSGANATNSAACLRGSGLTWLIATPRSLDLSEYCFFQRLWREL